MDPVLATFRPLTPSQKRIWKYFLAVAALLLVQILAGIIMAHSYYDRASFYGIPINDFLPFNFLRDVHIQVADCLDRAFLDRRSALSRSRHRRGPGG